MIYYYSGTGNTCHVASRLAEQLGERLHFIPQEDAPLPRPGESVGFLFPIYSWGVPPIVTEFIERLGADALSGRYVWGACTCGDEAGIAMRLFNRQIKRLRGTPAAACFSVIMPNDYVLLPGFDVDTPEVAERKLAAAPARINEIAAAVAEKRTGLFDVHEGSMPALRTRLVFPLFRRWGVNARYWAVSDECVSCGRCAEVCPVGNIEMTGGHPLWHENCLSCCACYNVCPMAAISYRTFTRGKGQYFFPKSRKPRMN
ncbi:MAG: 4Fe-4S binding protein [Bacteroidales bacterium]|nr:4Fe-4S binding protein [Bacteroidales bacterium]